MKTALLRTVRDVVRADSDPVRQALIEHVRTSNAVVRLVWRIHDRLGRSHLASLSVFLFGAVSYAAPAPSSREAGRALLVAVHENARDRARQLTAWVGEDSVTWLRLGARRLLSAGALGRLLGMALCCGAWMRAYRVVRRLDGGHSFLVACRGASAVFGYLRAGEILRQIESSGVIVSSDSNPEPLAFARAAASLGIPTVFISHAYPTPVSPRLDYTLSVLEGEAARKGYEEKGPIRGHVILCGVEGESRPMRTEGLRRERPTIGVFPPKVVLWPEFGRLIEDCRRLFGPERILIRWHPSMLGASRLSTTLRDMSHLIETDPGQPLQAVAGKCDWVIADESSNVHLGVLKAGVPTVPVKGLSVLPASRSDLYGFVASRVIPSPVTRLGEISVDELEAFYSHGWEQRFRRYDAGYLARPGRLAEEAGAEIARVLAGTSPRSRP